MLDAIVLIRVGKEKTPFPLHKGLLCNASPYFRACLQGEFKEAQSQTIDWPEENPEIVKVFQFWLYSGNLDAPTSSKWEYLVDLYSFGDKFDLRDFENEIVDTITDKIDKGERIPIPTFALIYNKTASHAPLRKLIVDLAVNHFLAMEESAAQASLLKNYPRELLVDIVFAKYDKTRTGKKSAKAIRMHRAYYYSK